MIPVTLAVNWEMLQEWSTRLLPCPFCGRAARFAKRMRGAGLRAECSVYGLPPCTIAPHTRTTRFIRTLQPGAGSLVYQETMQRHVETWNQRGGLA